MSNPAPAVDSPLSILRIKRRRGSHSLPLDALLIQPNEPSFKRRRNLGPPEIPAPNRAIFRFAETVASNSFDTENQTKQITDRISSFARRGPTGPALRRVSSNNSLNPSTPASPSRKRPSQFNPARHSATDPTSSPASRLADPTSAARRQDKVLGKQEEAKRARYRIIEKNRGLAEDSPRPVDSYNGPRPPQVLTASELNKPKPPRIYDAVEEGATHSVTNRANILPSKSDASDDLMASFVPMLQEYLSLQDNPGPSAASVAAGQSTSNVDKAEVDSDDDDEFVYDLYYKADHPQSNSAAGSLSPTGAFDDVSSLAGLQRIGELAGLDEDEILNDELSSEEEDEADQDSNDEGDYRNDYPSGDEEDSPDEDESDEWSD